MNPQPTPAGVRLVGTRLRLRRFVAFVRDADDAEEVRVRVQWKPTAALFRCDACGTSDRPRCTHALAAAHLLREGVPQYAGAAD